MISIVSLGATIAARRCDGNSDCPDSSDEADCEPYVADGCPSYQHGCAINGVGRCVPNIHGGDSWVCDGFLHCDDGSDETDCGLRMPPPRWRQLVVPWSTLPAAVQALGWTKETWENGPDPPSMGKDWEELSDAEQAGAVALGFT